MISVDTPITLFLSSLDSSPGRRVIIYYARCRPLVIVHASIIVKIATLMYTDPVPKNRKVCSSVLPNLDQELSSYQAKIRLAAQGV